MAFGDSDPPSNHQIITAKQQRACAALCDAAKRGHVHLIGNPAEYGNRSDPIPAAYFDAPRSLGHKINSLETELHGKSMDEFIAARNDRKHERYEIWTNVRVETKSFLACFFPKLSLETIDIATQDDSTIESDKTTEVTTKPRKGKVGRKAKYDWHEVEIIVSRELDQRGDFDDPNQTNDWNSQASMERLVAEYLSKPTGETASSSRIREKIKPMIQQWRLSNKPLNTGN